MIRGGSIVLAATAWLMGTAAPAQDRDPPRGARPNPAGDGGLLNSEIDDLLQRWHERTKKVTQLYAGFRRTVFDKAFKTERINDGRARFREPNLARMDIAQDEKGQGREIFILSTQPRPAGGTGLEIRHYVADVRKVQIHEFPDDAARNAQDEGPLRLLFGIKPETAHARYTFDVLKKTADAIAIRIVPKMERERQEFLEAALVLDLKSFMPRMLKVKENAETEVTYEFSQIVTNVDDPTLEILLTDFDPPKINEREWQVTRQRLVVDKGPSSGQRK
jgi:TIGR03009 family protein